MPADRPLGSRGLDQHGQPKWADLMDEDYPDYYTEDGLAYGSTTGIDRFTADGHLRVGLDNMGDLESMKEEYGYVNYDMLIHDAINSLRDAIFTRGVHAATHSIAGIKCRCASCRFRRRGLGQR